MSLNNLLSSINDDRLLWVTQSDTMTAGQIRRKVALLKSNLIGLQGQRIVIEINDHIEAFLFVLALDGIAESVFLVPESLLLSDDYPQLKKEFSCNLTINSLNQEDYSTETNNSLDAVLIEKLYSTSWVLATSGTTGTPKLITHSTLSLTRTCKVDQERGKDFVWGLVFDPFRFAGLQVVLQSLASSSTLVFANKVHDATSQFQFLKNSGVNALSATPTYWRRLLMSGLLNDHSFKQITLGGEPADQTILLSLRKAFPQARISHIYASTEAGVGFSVNDGLAGFPVDYLNNGVGNILLSISSESTLLINPGKHVPLASQGKSLANAEGYIDTGDIIEINNKRVFFLGRDSGAINVGGNKVIPEEVEAVIRMLEEVQEVVVKPKKSGLMGQLVTAEIVLQKNIDKKTFRMKLIHHCSQYLEKFKIPALIRFVDNIDANSTGKIDRR